MEKCGHKTQVYARCCGFYTPVQQWNDGKQQEFKDRKVFNVDKYGEAKELK